jgi:hypothetical protein
MQSALGPPIPCEPRPHPLISLAPNPNQPGVGKRPPRADSAPQGRPHVCTPPDCSRSQGHHGRIPGEAAILNAHETSVSLPMWPLRAPGSPLHCQTKPTATPTGLARGGATHARHGSHALGHEQHGLGQILGRTRHVVSSVPALFLKGPGFKRIDQSRGSMPEIR